jgi:putative oxidoreductase
MSTSTATYPRSTSTWTVSTAHAAMYLVPLGRLLFAAIFLLAAPGHFKQETIQYAASAGVPAANLLVPASGILAFVGGALILLGWHARIGALLLIAFLLPVTLTMHAFWSVADPAMHQLQQGMFMKNLGLMGGALLIAYFGSGPMSLDARREGQVG